LAHAEQIDQHRADPRPRKILGVELRCPVHSDCVQFARNRRQGMGGHRPERGHKPAFVIERNCLGGLGTAIADKFVNGVPVVATFGEIPLGAFAFIGERITFQPGRPSTPQAVVTGSKPSLLPT